MSLDDLRKRINALDERIVALLDERAGLMGAVLQAKRDAKLPTFDPEREREVLERLARMGDGRFPAGALRAVFREVMSASRALQDAVTVAFLGPAGSFSHAAARRLFGLSASYQETTTIDGVFDALYRGVATYGVAPVENSSEGSVTHTVDALLESQGRVRIRRELVLDVVQCLMSRAPSVGAVRRVYSHPQALGQCRLWLAKNLAGAQLVQTPSTSAAAREAAADTEGAAIGSALAAEIYDLPVLRESVQDMATGNATRFIVIAREHAPRTGRDKTTLAFSLKEGRGALKRALEIFEQGGISLTRIESRPSRQRAWDYVFLCDLEGHADEAPVRAAIDALGGVCPSVTWLGSYPAAEGVTAP
ncbi:MAG TPA: prephenate dehydratase [Polyangiaceae bacterium]|nr:prephenate dehydratase [Polyangiaceae bacterium]